MIRGTMEIEGYGHLRPFAGAFANLGDHRTVGGHRLARAPGQSKLLADIDAALDACGVKDGASTAEARRALKQAPRLARSSALPRYDGGGIKGGGDYPPPFSSSIPAASAGFHHRRADTPTHTP